MALMRTCADIDIGDMDPIATLQAEVCRTLSHPARIAIVHLLADGPREVGRLARDLDISQPNASQHLAVMRNAGLVDAEREGREVHYRLSDPQIVEACRLMAAVLRRHYQRRAALADPSMEREPAVPATR
jgi:ArsR family transcriptional regulator